MWHLDIPKTRQYDNGEVEVIARNSSGEARIKTILTVSSRHDDYRGVLKNSPRRKFNWRSRWDRFFSIFVLIFNLISLLSFMSCI